MHRFQSICFACIAVVITACGTNPVTGERELQFVSEAQEIQEGSQAYAPARQSEGGDLVAMPELTAYVNEIGQKLAAVADRKLPYEFTVLNNSVPNAWAMPGGKIAVNRGLLTELKNEAELAAVLGHEIVHAAARHGAKGQERGTLMQAGLAALQIGAMMGGMDSNATALASAGAGVGAQALQMTFSRDQELQADQFGMTYMKRAGYDPTGAVTLQETFVRLSASKGGKAGLFDKWFASHPPSTERVAKNKEMAASLGAGGEIGAREYQTRLAALLKEKPAYDKFDEATAALKKKDYAKANTLAAEAARLFPQEARFHELQGDIELAQKHSKEALPYYEKAIGLNPNYYGAYLGGGVAHLQNGNRAKAQEWLKHSNELLPQKNVTDFLAKLAAQNGEAASSTR